jgi:hypothetical protein
MRTGGGSCAHASWAQTSGAAKIAARAIPNERANAARNFAVRNIVILPDAFWPRFCGARHYNPARANPFFAHRVIFCFPDCGGFAWDEYFSSQARASDNFGGCGIEYGLDPRWSVKAEALYVDLGRHSGVFQTNGDPNLQSGFSGRLETVDTMWIVRAGVNYKFDG